MSCTASPLRILTTPLNTLMLLYSSSNVDTAITCDCGLERIGTGKEEGVNRIGSFWSAVLSNMGKRGELNSGSHRHNRVTGHKHSVRKLDATIHTWGIAQNAKMVGFLRRDMNVNTSGMCASASVIMWFRHCSAFSACSFRDKSASSLAYKPQIYGREALWCDVTWRVVSRWYVVWVMYSSAVWCKGCTAH